MTFCGRFESLLFPRKMEQRAPWKSSRQNRVQDYGRIERFGDSISFIMHHRKPGAVFPASQRCSEGGQSWCRVRPNENKLYDTSNSSPPCSLIFCLVLKSWIRLSIAGTSTRGPCSSRVHDPRMGSSRSKVYGCWVTGLTLATPIHLHYTLCGWWCG